MSSPLSQNTGSQNTDSAQNAPAYVTAVQESLVRIRAAKKDGKAQALLKNEVVFIVPQRSQREGREEKLKAEILRINGEYADVQVFEDTRGVAIGDPVEQSGELLSVSLGPGLLGKVYDGLQNPLEDIAQTHGTFLPRGIDIPALDQNKKWSFVPCVQQHAQLQAGATLGEVAEGAFKHKIMVPFNLQGPVEVTWIQEGSVTVNMPVARLKDQAGEVHEVQLEQRWPVRKALADDLLRAATSERVFPHTPMSTTIRLVDTFFPLALGGTGCIPGPFGSGKTVLQHIIAKHSTVDIVIVVACGERAGEVVETITEFPHLKDPRTGGALIDRTIIICNTSSMPVAAREASMYTGVTLGEYYRQMGFNVLLLADSTSRWAQAMRETSGRLEEIPGDEAFPAYLDSNIRNIYERAGVIKNSDGEEGSLTMIGTVSPAGGSFEEPVTQSTLNTVKNFLGLSYDRAYKRFYPAIDPLISWSRYLDQLTPWLTERFGKSWVPKVQALKQLLNRGDAVQKMMQVSGEEGISLEDYLVYEKALFVDMVYLQQDAFDPVDASVSLERQAFSFDLVNDIVQAGYDFKDQKSAHDYFMKQTGLLKNFNYAATGSSEYANLVDEIKALLAQNSVQTEESVND